MKILYLALGDVLGVIEDLKTLAEQNMVVRYLDSTEETFKKYLDKRDKFPNINLAEYKRRIYDFADVYGRDSPGLGMMFGLLQDKISDIETTQGRLEEITGADNIAECGKLLYYAVQEINQMCWLSILEDYYCEKFENAIKNADTWWQEAFSMSERLVIAVLPEFALSKSHNPKEKPIISDKVAKCFFDGTLPDRLYHNRTMKRFVQLSKKYSTSRQSMIIFAGSIRVREAGTGTRKNVVSNIVPVFYNGALSRVWEKQMISDEDGISKAERHTVLFDDFGKRIIGKSGDFYSGNITRNILARFGLGQITPVFDMTVFKKQISFAVSVCLDYMSVEIINGQTAHIHLLMSAGMHASDCLDNIVALKLFAFCDGYFIPGLVAAFENIKQDLSYWKTYPYDSMEKTVRAYSDMTQDRIFTYKSSITVP